MKNDPFRERIAVQIMNGDWKNNDPDCYIDVRKLNKDYLSKGWYPISTEHFPIASPSSYKIILMVLERHPMGALAEV